MKELSELLRYKNVLSYYYYTTVKVKVTHGLLLINVK